MNSSPARPLTHACTNLQLNYRLVFRCEVNLVFILVENTDWVKSLGESEKSTAKKAPKLLLHSAMLCLERALTSLYRGKY